MMVWKGPQVESDLVVKVKYYQAFIFLVILEVKLMDKLWGKDLDYNPQCQQMVLMSYLFYQMHFFCDWWVVVGRIISLILMRTLQIYVGILFHTC